MTERMEHNLATFSRANEYKSKMEAEKIVETHACPYVGEPATIGFKTRKCTLGTWLFCLSYDDVDAVKLCPDKNKHETEQV
jgi:hypothetical protein